MKICFTFINLPLDICMVTISVTSIYFVSVSGKEINPLLFFKLILNKYRILFCVLSQVSLYCFLRKIQTFQCFNDRYTSLYALLKLRFVSIFKFWLNICKNHLFTKLVLITKRIMLKMLNVLFESK